MDSVSSNPSAAAAVFSKDNTGLTESSVAHDSKGPFLLMSGYEAANDSPARGYLYWRTTDTRRELSDFSEEEIRRRVHWLYANTGIGRRMVRGPAKLLGIQTPFPVTSQPKWNDLAFENFVAKAGSKNIFDRKGRHDFFTIQPPLNRARFKDGRVLTALTETPSRSAQTLTYEAHQIASEWDDDRYEQGLLLDRFDKHIGYRVRDGKDPEKYETLESRNAMYYANWDSFGGLHGLSILAHAVVNLIDVVELRGLRKHAAKNHAAIGMAVETAPTAKVVSGGAAGVGGPMVVQEVVTTSGEKQEVNWEIMTTQGQVPRLQPGESIKVVADDRPTPNNMEFERALVEDCILGADLPPSALYYVAGLTGPAIRFNMDEIKRWIEIEHRTQAEWCQRYWAYHIAKEIKTGRLPYIDEPYWRKVHWIGQTDLTIDKGRDGNLCVVQMDSGLTTWGDEYAKKGQFGRSKIRERIREVAQAKQDIAEAEEEFGVELSYTEVFPRWANVQSQQPEEEAA